MAPLRALCCLLGHGLLTRSNSRSAPVEHSELHNAPIEWRAGGAIGLNAPIHPFSKAPGLEPLVEPSKGAWSQ
eukprot:14472292-Heterocapsa_arctica.AAC.1